MIILRVYQAAADLIIVTYGYSEAYAQWQKATKENTYPHFHLLYHCEKCQFVGKHLCQFHLFIAENNKNRACTTCCLFLIVLIMLLRRWRV